MPANVDLVAAALAKAASEGMAIVVVDASFDLLRTACSRLYIMDLGRLVGEYKPTDFATPQQLAAAYLGEQAHA